MTWADSLVDQIADRVFQRIEKRIETAGKLNADTLTYSEHEAAELLGIPKHVLKDARLRGEIDPQKIGKSYRYGREMLIAFAEKRS